MKDLVPSGMREKGKSQKEKVGNRERGAGEGGGGHEKAEGGRPWTVDGGR